MVDFPSGVAATDPTFLVGANATDAAKLAINAQGRSLVSAADATAQRTVMKACAEASLEVALTEPFLNGTSGLAQGIVSTVTGGTNAATTVTGRQGLVKMAVGTAATADRTCLLGSMLAATISLGAGVVEFTVEGAPTTALASGGVTGVTHIGLHDAPNSNVEPTDGCYFRSTNGGNYFAVCRSNNVETAVDTGILPVLDTYLFFRVTVNAGATSVDFTLYNSSGTQIDTRTITTDIPTGSGRQVGHGVRIVRITATGTDHSFNVDTFFFKHVFTTALPF
jgi:hypothetical protein